MNLFSIVRRFIQHFPALRRFIAFNVVPSGLRNPTPRTELSSRSVVGLVALNE